MTPLKNKWVHFALLLVMIYLIVNSSDGGRKAINYVKNTEKLKQDISYTFSRTKEVVAVSQMTKDEIAKYYLGKQKQQEAEKQVELNNANKEKNNGNVDKNIKGLAQLSQLMKPSPSGGNTQVQQTDNKEQKDANIQKNHNDNNQNVSDEQKLFSRDYVEKMYGSLKEVIGRTIKCGDYVEIEYNLFEDKKPLNDTPLKMFLLVGSGIVPEMENIVKNMFPGQIKSIDIATRENYSDDGVSLKSTKIIQEIKIIKVDETQNKSALNCEEKKVF
jgi:hypothetical protein